MQTSFALPSLCRVPTRNPSAGKVSIFGHNMAHEKEPWIFGQLPWQKSQSASQLVRIQCPCLFLCVCVHRSVYRSMFDARVFCLRSEFLPSTCWVFAPKWIPCGCFRLHREVRLTRLVGVVPDCLAGYGFTGPRLQMPGNSIKHFPLQKDRS